MNAEIAKSEVKKAEAKAEELKEEVTEAELDVQDTNNKEDHDAAVEKLEEKKEEAANSE